MFDGDLENNGCFNCTHNKSHDISGKTDCTLFGRIVNAPQCESWRKRVGNLLNSYVCIGDECYSLQQIADIIGNELFRMRMQTGEDHTDRFVEVLTSIAKR